MIPKGTKRLNPSQIRALRCLLAGQPTVNEIRDTAGRNNGADVVLKLRRRLGIVCPVTLREKLDRDGRRVEIGAYCPTERDRELIRAALAAPNTAIKLSRNDLRVVDKPVHGSHHKNGVQHEKA